MNGQPAGAVGLTQNIVVPNVALWRLPRPEPRNRVPIRPRMGGGAEKVEEKIRIGKKGANPQWESRS
jgi:hypothetical protein